MDDSFRFMKDISRMPGVYEINCGESGKFAASVAHLEAKRFSASGGLRPPDPLTRGSAPAPRWGLRPQTRLIGSRSRARHARGSSPPNMIL